MQYGEEVDLSVEDEIKMDALAAEYADEYNVTIISNGNCKYNCYLYAWYSQSTSNIYWIDDPLAYMTDGSYSRVITSAAIDEPLATRIVTSKWGKMGVYRGTR